MSYINIIKTNARKESRNKKQLTSTSKKLAIALVVLFWGGGFASAGIAQGNMPVDFISPSHGGGRDAPVDFLRPSHGGGRDAPVDFLRPSHGGGRDAPVDFLRPSHGGGRD